MTKIDNEEIAYNLRLARAVRAKTEELLVGLGQAEFDWQPSKSGWIHGEKSEWSLGEHVHHILRVEAYIRTEVIEKLIEMSQTESRPYLRKTVSDINLAPAFIPGFLLGPAEVFFSVNNRLTRCLIPRPVTELLFRHLSFPATTPQPWAPAHGRRKTELLDELSKSLDLLAGVVEKETPVAYQDMVFEHTVIGRHTAAQMTRIVSIHEEWHQDRMVEVLEKLPRNVAGS